MLAGALVTLISLQRAADDPLTWAQTSTCSSSPFARHMTSAMMLFCRTVPFINRHAVTPVL